MTSRLNMIARAVACAAICSVGFANIARADDDTMKPNAMSSDHMGANKAMTKKHVMKKPMAKAGAMSSDHMAPEAPKQ